MSTPVKLRLYCSICARNDFYMDRITGRCRRSRPGLHSGENHRRRCDRPDGPADTLPVRLLPRLPVLNEQVTSEHPETLCTPALEINGTLRFWGVPASDDALRQALSSL